MSFGGQARRAIDWARQVQPNWMPRDARLVMDARGCMSAVDGLTQVILPIYLSILGFSGLQLGLLFAAVTSADAVFSTLVGVLSDRIGRKPFMVGMPLLTAISGLVFAVTRNQALIFVFAAIGSFGWGTGAVADATGPYAPAEQAWIADTVNPIHRTSVFGRLAFAASVGSLIGLQLAGGIPLGQHFGLSAADAFRPLFFACGLLALAASLLALPITDRKAPARARRNLFAVSPSTWPLVIKFSVANMVNGLGVGLFGPFVTYFLYRRYGAGPQMIALLFSMINIVALASNLSAAGVARKIGLVRSMTISWLLQAVLLIPMALAPNFWLAGGIYFVRMFIQRLNTPLRRSYIVAVSPPDERGSVAGLTGLPTQGAIAVAPLFAGYLFERAALSAPFEVGAVLQALGTGLFWVFFHNVHPPEELPAAAQGGTVAPVASVPVH